MVCFCVFAIIINQYQIIMNTSWNELTQKYSLDQKYGFLVPPQYKVESFDFQTLLKVNMKAQQMETDEELSTLISQVPDLKLKPPHSQADLLILHDFTVHIINIYLAKKRSLNINEQGIKIPKHLAEPLYLSANILGLHYGIGAAISYNWVPLNNNYLKDDASFGFDDFTLKVNFTKNKQQELLFLGGSIIGSFYLAKIVKLIFEINQIIKERPNEIDQVKQKLSLCAKYWEKIAIQNRKVADNFSADYFNNQLRPKLKGYTNLVLEGVDNGEDLTITSPGGTAGFDPTFQMFEVAFGIKSSGLYQKMQLNLRGGMSKTHIQCIKQFQKESLIRQYCQNCNDDIKNQYNLVLKAYGKFFRIHSEFMIKFILNPKNTVGYDVELSAEKGTAGTIIKQIVLRYENIESQVLS